MKQHVASRLSALLALAAAALLTLMIMAANLARVGSAIAGEISRVQGHYLSTVTSGPLAERNALLLGQCLRREMLKVAQAGFVHDDTWAVATRARAMPRCVQQLSALPSPLRDMGPEVDLAVARARRAHSPLVLTQAAAAMAGTSAR